MAAMNERFNCLLALASCRENLASAAPKKRASGDKTENFILDVFVDD